MYQYKTCYFLCDNLINSKASKGKKLVRGLKNEEWLSFLQRVCEMEVHHISAYCLTIEDKTKLKNDIKKVK